jgi:hypothetical protein
VEWSGVGDRKEQQYTPNAKFCYSPSAVICHVKGRGRDGLDELLTQEHLINLIFSSSNVLSTAPLLITGSQSYKTDLELC